MEAKAVAAAAGSSVPLSVPWVRAGDHDPAKRFVAAIEPLENGGIGSLTAVPARKLDGIRRLTTRVPAVRILEADVCDAPPVALSESEAAMLEGLDDGCAACELDKSSVRRLARAGVIDLV